jgi:DNA polymerase III epsilon subunit-like protein
MVEAQDDKNAVARVTIVALKGPLYASVLAEKEVLFDRLYHPAGRVIVDYRTGISGLSKELLETAEGIITDFAVLQAEVLKLIPEQCVLVGHGLSHDLVALKMKHKRVIDTGFVFCSPLKHQLLGLRVR